MKIHTQEQLEATILQEYQAGGFEHIGVSPEGYEDNEWHESGSDVLESIQSQGFEFDEWEDEDMASIKREYSIGVRDGLLNIYQLKRRNAFYTAGVFDGFTKNQDVTFIINSYLPL